MLKQLSKLIFALSIALGHSLPAQAETAPDQLVKNLTEEVLSQLRTNKDAIKEQGVDNYVSKVILPHFDFDYMSRLVLAKHWRKANDQQKADFTKAFKGLLISTYAGSLLEYQDENVEFLPFRADSKDPSRAKVSIEIVPSAGPVIPMDYSLRNQDGVWKVYDVSVDGLSMVTNYRRSFGKKVKQEGLDALISGIMDKIS